MSGIGVIAMPADFSYREVFLRGKPEHDRFDLFRIRHPSMDAGKRAKIFAPFDALRGFSAALLVVEAQSIAGRADREQGAPDDDEPLPELYAFYDPNEAYELYDLVGPNPCWDETEVE